MSLSGTTCISIAKLRLTWNAFARLLVVPLTELFVCPECGPEPKVVVCDGTTLGCNKTLLNSLPSDPVSEEGNILGSKYKDRTFITHNQTRKLILKYATEKLSHAEMASLLKLLQDTNQEPLANFLKYIHADRYHRCFSAPLQYKNFFKDIASPGPACSLFQGAQTEDLTYMKAVLNSNEPIFKNEYAKVMAFLQKKFPIFAEFLFASREGDQVPVVAQNLLMDVIRIGLQAFNVPGERCYTAVDEGETIEGTHCFPSLPKLHRYLLLLLLFKGAYYDFPLVVSHCM